MDYSIVTEVIVWAVQISHHHHHLTEINLSIVTSPSIGNLIMLGYLVVLAFNKKGRYIAAFILCDVSSYFYSYPSLTGYEIYFGYAFVYSILYWVLTIDKAKLKTRLACGIIVLFDARMTLHAYFHGDYEAFIYVNYEYITLLAHICLIATLLPWKLIGRSVVNYYRVIYDGFRYSDDIAYICYNWNTQARKAEKR